jgi:hypothetical protein
MSKEKQIENTVKYYLSDKIVGQGYAATIGEGAEAVQCFVIPEVRESYGGATKITRPVSIVLDGVNTGKGHFENLTFSQLKTLVGAKVVKLTKEQARQFVKDRSEYLKGIKTESQPAPFLLTAPPFYPVPPIKFFAIGIASPANSSGH